MEAFIHSLRDQGAEAEWVRTGIEAPGPRDEPLKGALGCPAEAVWGSELWETPCLIYSPFLVLVSPSVKCIHSFIHSSSQECLQHQTLTIGTEGQRYI